MGNNLLNLVVKFTSMDGLSGSLKSMIGLGKSSAQEMKALSRELGQARTRFKELDAAISQGKLTDSIRYRHELARQEVADVERLIAQRKRLLEIDGRTAAIRARASTLKSEGMSGLMGTMMFAAPAAMAVMHEASAYQREMARIDALGLGSGVAQQADKFARSANIIGNSTRDMAHAYGDALAIFKNTHEADFVAPIIGKMHFANKALYGEEGGEHDQALQSLMKTIEYRGGTKSEAAFLRQAEYAQKVVNASRGRVNGNEMLAAMKIGGSLAQQMSDKAFFLNSEPLIQEMTGNKFGNALAAMYSNLVGGHGTIPTQREMLRLGLLDPKKVEFNKLGMLKKAMPGAADISVLRDDGVLSYLEKVLLPAFAKKGITGDTAIIEEFSKIFSNSRAANMLTSVYRQREKLKMQSAANEKAMGIDGSVNVAKDTFAGKSADFSAKWHSFLEVAGKKGGLMDMAISLMGKMTTALDGLTSFGNRHPTAFKWIVTAVTALVGMNLAIAAGKLAFGSLLGPVGQLWGLWSKYQVAGNLITLFPRIATAIELLTGPIGWTIAGVTALAAGAYLIYRNWGGITGFFQKHATSLRNLALGIGVMMFPMVAAFALVIHRYWPQIKAFFGWLAPKAWAVVKGLAAPFVWLGKEAFKFGSWLVLGLVHGIESLTSTVVMAVVHLAEKVGGTFAKEMGIHSPSRVMMAMGGHLATGLAHGMDQNGHHPVRAMRRMATAVAGAGALALAPAGHARAPSAPRGGDHIEIHIHQQPGENADALAERVLAAIERKMRARRLGSYQDDF